MPLIKGISHANRTEQLQETTACRAVHTDLTKHRSRQIKHAFNQNKSSGESRCPGCSHPQSSPLAAFIHQACYRKNNNCCQCTRPQEAHGVTQKLEKLTWTTSRVHILECSGGPRLLALVKPARISRQSKWEIGYVGVEKTHVTAFVSDKRMFGQDSQHRLDCYKIGK